MIRNANTSSEDRPSISRSFVSERSKHFHKSTIQAESINKVFCIGFQKTGTKTLHKALETLVYKVCGCRHVLIDPLKRDDWQPVLEMVEENDAFEDNPWPLLYKRLDQEFPNSRFILTIRDNDKWLRSVVNYFETGINLIIS